MIKNDIKKEYIVAMKEKNEGMKSCLNVLLSKFTSYEIDKKTSLSDEDCIAIIKKEVKQIEETMGFAEKSGNTGLVNDCISQITYLSKYVPVLMDEKELFDKISFDISNGVDASNKGEAIRFFISKYGTVAEKKDISKIVGQLFK